MHAKKEFFDNLSRTYKNSCPKKLEIIKGRIVPLLNLSPNDNVLDICSGTGVLVPFLTPRLRLTEVDFSQKMLDEAKRLHGERAEYVLANVENLPFTNDTFTKAICHNALPHIDDKVKAFREIYKVLISGGAFVISHDGAKCDIDNRHKKAGGCVAQDLLPSNEVLSEMLQKAGFQEIKIIDDKDMFAAVCVK
jgi:demethylmenaquinone methyltransferase/2-methoxy-6-polyprenyl-1,4-benzoquinol methylase